MSHPTVLVISYHFYPSNEIGARRPTALARFLVEKGVRVAVVSAFGGQEIVPGSQVLPGVFAVPVRKPPRIFTEMAVRAKRRLSGSNRSAAPHAGSNPASIATQVASSSFLAKIRESYFRVSDFVDDYKSWGRRAYKAAVREGREHPPTLVFSSHPPPTVLLVGAFTARRLGVPHIADLRDPWSDMISALHPNRRIELALGQRIEGWVMRSAAAITSTGTRVAQLLIGRQPRLAAKTFIVRNGYDEAIRQSAPDTGGRLSILFAGELYLNRDPFPLLLALERLLSRPDVDSSRVRMTFMGRNTGYAGKSFDDWLQGKRCAAIVKFVPAQGPELVAEATLESTVVLNLAQRQPLSIPAKTFEHLASGRENLLLCEDDSDSAQLVANIGGVVQVDPRNVEALDRVLEDLYHRHVVQGLLRAPAQQDVAPFSRAAANEGFWRVMKSIAAVDIQETSREST
jgi:hypothetical protein